MARAEAAQTGVATARWLFSLLQNYNLRELSEDVLKSLYQELVDPAARHDLGEFYTPDWLAQRIVRRLLGANPRLTILDPTCGSGTFIYLAIQEKRRRMGDGAETLQHILASVCGADIHPLAVIIAKTNYILALGDLLRRRAGAITIPVYLADTLRLPEHERDMRMIEANGILVQQVPGFTVTLDDVEVHLPEMLLTDPAQYDQAIEWAKEYARQHKGQPILAEAFRNYLAAQRFPHAEDAALVQALFAITATLKRFLERDRDTIWAFVLKNIYKPLFLRQRFDCVVGNPPWIAYHFIEQPAYQEFLKRQIIQGYRLLRGRAELITHLELATLFLLRAADLYPKPGGTIAFVLPRSIFSADQHDGLRRRSFSLSENPAQTLVWREVWDLEGVTPLFRVPACVLIAEKRPLAEVPRSEAPTAPLPGEILHGQLGRKNAALAEAEGTLEVQRATFALHTREKRSFWGTGSSATHQRSYYANRFSQGATLVPRPFWFVEVTHSPLGFDPHLPPLETAQRARKEAKDAYQGLVLRGRVESRFLYATLLSTDLLPFGHLPYRLVVLPIEPQDDRYRLLDAQEARQRGFLYLAEWLERVEAEWTQRRGAKAGRMTALEWLDYRRKLTVQNPHAPWRVLYNVSGTYLTACALETEAIGFAIGEQRIVVKGFVADYVTYYYETESRDEALFLAAVLNAPAVDKAVKPMQARGLWGPRHICKKVLELPIPLFDAQDCRHQHLAELGAACQQRMAEWLATTGTGATHSIGRLRADVRRMLQAELEEIDALAQSLLGGGTP